MALCPAHSDETESLSIWKTDTGDTGISCKAGCPWGTVIDQLRDRFPDAFPQSNGRKSKGKIIAEYDYRDADGELLGQVVRLDPKSFRQRKPDGSGGWTWKLDGLKFPLYHLPDVLKVNAIYVVEGEKDADALRAIGLPATCNPGGAGKWLKHHTDALAGKKVCIIPDKDEPGRAHGHKVAAALKGTAASVRIIYAPDPHKDPAAWIEGGGTRDQIIEAAKSALTWDGNAPPPPAGAGLDPRNIIQIVKGELPRMVDEAEIALLAFPDHGGLYQRGGQIVRVVRLESSQAGSGVKRAAGSPVIQIITMPALVEALSRAASWIQFDGRTDDWRPRDCPRLVAETYAARAGSWEMRPLVGVVDMPTLRSDGSILQALGYDKNTGLLLLSSAPVEIKPDPDREDSMEAIRQLLQPLEGFPFDSPISQSVALAAILTACVRYAIPTAPMFLFDAPAPGTGKSLLADVVSIISTGTPAPSMSQAPNPEEEGKRLFAALLEGAPIICIDNAERPFEGDVLSSILTQPSYRGRVLGSSVTATVPTAVTFLGTGNNISVKGDLTRRVLLCRLDAALEHPEDRLFVGDLRKTIRERRPELAAAALTVLRAYQVAGCPDQAVAPYGGFEQWSTWVRNALIWAGQDDPCASRSRIQTGDESARQLDALLTAWEKRFGMMTGTIQEAMKDPPEYLQEATADIAGDRKGNVNARKLGKWIARYEARICKGRYFAAGSMVGSRRTWKIIAAE